MPRRIKLENGVILTLNPKNGNYTFGNLGNSVPETGRVYRFFATRQDALAWLHGTPTTRGKEQNAGVIRPAFWQRWKLAIWIALGTAITGGMYYLLEQVLDLF